MEPVNLLKRMPEPDDKLILSDKSKSCISGEFYEEVVVRHGGCYVTRIDLFSDGIYFVHVKCNCIKQAFLVKEDGSPAWGSYLCEKWPVFYWPDAEVCGIDISREGLKKLNTTPQATVCFKCKGQLKDPGLGPTYKHCPVCEP